MAMLTNIARRSCSVYSLKSVQRILWSSNLLPKQAIPTLSSLCQNQSFSTSNNKVLYAEHASHNHTPLWTAEKILSAGLLGLLPAAFIWPGGILDYAAAIALVAHIHWGVEATVHDYARPAVIGNTLANVTVALTYVFSALTLGGLFYFNYTDVGLMQAIRMLWKL